MFFNMLTLSKDFKVFNRIVKPISVNMVNNLRGFKSSSKEILHKKPMFFNSPSVSSKQSISFCNSSHTSRIPNCLVWITVFVKSVKVHITKATRFVLVVTKRNCAFFNRFSSWHIESNSCSPSNVMKMTKSFRVKFIKTAFNKTYLHEDIVPC